MDTYTNKQDSDILFSRTVKAGRRVYYVDVKQDRRGGYYVSITESKRVRDGVDGQNPVFEKHKIFLYREDLQKFMEAFAEVAKFTESQPAAASSELPENIVAEEPSPAEPDAKDTDFSWEFWGFYYTWFLVAKQPTNPGTYIYIYFD